MDVRVTQAALFALAGVSSFAYWILADPGPDTISTEWRYVLLFSLSLLALGVALPVFGSMVGGRFATRVSLVAGSAAVFGSVVNIVEDGLGVEWAFWGFVAATAIQLLALLVLTVVVALATRNRRRWWALVPAGTALAILLYVQIGGIIMLVTWLAAAAVALGAPAARSASQEAHA